MSNITYDRSVKLSIVIPCYNEELTLSNCVDKVLKIADNNLSLEIIIVDDCSTDQSLSVAICMQRILFCVSS